MFNLRIFGEKNFYIFVYRIYFIIFCLDILYKVDFILVVVGQVSDGYVVYWFVIFNYYNL